MTSTTKPATRIAALLGALFFFVTSAGLSVFVVWQLYQDSHSKTNNTSLNDTKTDSKAGKLKGTKLSNFTPVAKVPKLETIDTKVGTGAEAKAGSTVTVEYTGAIAKTGVVFESSLDSGQPATFGLDQVIKGWTEGIPGMKVGGTRRLLIPAALAYGNKPNGDIPANSDLVFDVTLKSVK